MATKDWYKMNNKRYVNPAGIILNIRQLPNGSFKVSKIATNMGFGGNTSQIFSSKLKAELHVAQYMRKH